MLLVLFMYPIELCFSQLLNHLQALKNIEKPDSINFALDIEVVISIRHLDALKEKFSRVQLLEKL